MQPNGNVIVDTICRTAKLGTTITGATENGDVTVIEAEPVEPIMFGLYMLAIYLGVAVIAAGFVALLVVVALAVGLVTHPIRTLALVFHKLAALAAGLALILALIVWFWYDHSKPDFVPCFWGSIGVIVASILIRAFAEWILERPTRAERRAMKRAAAQGTGRVTMRMPVSEEVAAAFESTRDGRRASL